MWKEYDPDAPIERQEPDIKMPFESKRVEGTYEEEIDDLLELAGVNRAQNEMEGAPRQTLEQRSADSHRKRELEREYNIQPGTDEWFRLNFARPDITGETPHDKW